MVYDHAGPYPVPPGLGLNKRIRRYVKAKTGVTPSVRKRKGWKARGLCLAGERELVKRSVALDDARDAIP